MRNRPGHLWGGHFRNGSGLPAVAWLFLLAAVLSVAAVVVTVVPATAALPPPEPGIPRVPGLAIAVSPPRLDVAAGKITKVHRLEVENRGSLR